MSKATPMGHPKRRTNRLVAFAYAVEVARQGSFSAAARAQGVTQPTVSAAVADLEERLGVTLFVRTTRSVTLTHEGERILPLAAASLRALEAIEFEAALMREPEKARVRVGFTPLVGAHRISGLVRGLREVQASVDIVLVETSNDALESALDTGSLDVVFGSGLRASKRRGRLVVYEDQLRLVRLWTGLRPVEIELDEAARLRLLLTADLCGLATGTRAIFATAGVAFEAYEGRTMSYGTLEKWAELGLGGAILPECHLDDSGSHPLLVSQGKPATIVVEAVWRKDAVANSAEARFVRYLKDARRVGSPATAASRRG
jgi:DNA-binding transcriptional LysR family regulator